MFNKKKKKKKEELSSGRSDRKYRGKPLRYSSVNYCNRYGDKSYSCVYTPHIER